MEAVVSDRSVKSWTVEADASPEAAFQYLSDVGKHGEWSPKLYRVDPVPQLPLQQGSPTSHTEWYRATKTMPTRSR